VTDLALEQRLIDAFADARASVHANPDLFARVTRSLDEARARRRFRWKLAGGVAAFIIANVVLALALSYIDNRSFDMPWWVIELITNIVLVALAIGLGPFIKRFGRSYAADVFRANPRTGKSYLVLTDVAYYLIFTAFVLFTVTFVAPFDWRVSTGNQLKDEVARVGGILLIMGILHAANVVALPIIGRLLSSRRLDDRTSTEVPPLGQGTWILHVEPAPGSSSPSGPPTPPTPPT
jgi:MFS family permease